MKHRLESRLLEVSTVSDRLRIDTTLMAKSEEELKSLLMKVKEENEKPGLKLIQKTKIMASGPITSWQIDEEKVETMADFISLGSKITVDHHCRHKIKRCLCFGKCYDKPACCLLSHFSSIRLFLTPRTVTYQPPLSMGFSRQEYWSGLPCPPPGDLPDSGIAPMSLTSLELAGGLFTTSATWEAYDYTTY